jgi:hypothetical protein
MATQDPFFWQKNAECTGMETSKFFDDEDGSDHDPKEYKKICASCPVIWECLETGIIYNFDGVWGGLKARDRRHKYPPEYRKQLIEEREELGIFTKLDQLAA